MGRSRGFNHNSITKQKMSDSARRRVETLGTPKAAFVLGHVPANKGIMLTHEQRANIKAGVQKQQRYTCACGVTTTAGNFKRWHGENCKHAAILL
jgi:hypothetical protein